LPMASCTDALRMTAGSAISTTSQFPVRDAEACVVLRFLHPHYRADASGKDWKNPPAPRCNLSGNVNRVFIIWKC
jgi:hypothetical protein